MVKVGMFITTINQHGLVQSAVDWHEIESAIRCMDGMKISELVLQASDRAEMTIGGGGEYYLVSLTLDGRVFFELCGNGLATNRVEFVAGGQLVRCKGTEVVGLKDALEAAKWFAEEGKLAPSLSWRQYGEVGV